MLGAKKVKYCDAREFKNECSEYFKRYYNFLAMQEPLVLPSKFSPANVKGIVDTMKKWCQSTGKRGHLNGFVLHSFLIKDLYLKMFNHESDDLHQKRNIEEFPSTPTITVYNTNERIFFLVRFAQSENLKNEIKLCCAELKILIILVGDRPNGKYWY